MNYLLWNELPEEDIGSGLDGEETLSVRSLRKAHKLDIVKVACSKGHFVSIGLDRLASFWFFDHRTRIHSHLILPTAALHPPLWPIIATAVDDTGHWVAILTDSGRVALWSLAEHRFVKSRVFDLRSQSPSIFAFASCHMDKVERLSLLVVMPNGRLTELDFRTGQLWTHQVSDVPLSSAVLSCWVKGLPKVISVSKNGVIYLSSPSSGEWTSETFNTSEDWRDIDGLPSKVEYAYTIPTLRMLAAVRSCQVDLIDIPTRALVHTFQTGQIKGRTLRILHGQRKTCGCHSATVPNLSIGYTDSETQNCMIHTYTPGEGSANSLICLRPSALAEDEHITCSGFENATESLHSVHRPGTWEATNVPSIVGIRKRPATDTSVVKSTSDIGYLSATVGSSNTNQNGSSKHCDPSSSGRANKNGVSANGSHRTPAAFPSSQNSGTEDWEAWTLSATGELHTIPLSPRTQSDSISEEFVEEEQWCIRY
ncbi:hypothetical protein B0J12DRAFT_777398 [Macrophomina phaseolina]|uniref:Uncharacterized protein n=1 Tax=Macrophomina phaseolina TaxID=35725 RepID=A0ABQ8FQM0_9PEZI|nr:hypothetical protein B0J12DRAFT_777398 [Macrophomina phaseolina]